MDTNVGPLNQEVLGLLTNVQTNLDHNFDKICRLIENREELKEILELLADEIGRECEPPGEPPEVMSALTIYGESFAIPKVVLELNMSPAEDDIGSYLFNAELGDASKWLCLLRESGTLNCLWKLTSDLAGYYSYHLGGLEIGNDSIASETFAKLKVAREKWERDKALPSVDSLRESTKDQLAGLSLDGDISSEASSDDHALTSTLGRIDFSLGECQYITGNQSEMFTQGSSWKTGLSDSQMTFAEDVFRSWGPRKMISYLRNVAYLHPTQRGAMHLRTYASLGITVLFIKDRALTFGWTRKLPRDVRGNVLNSLSAQTHSEFVRIAAMSTTRNRYRLLCGNERQ